MKKLLIGSTALVAAGMLAGNASAADKIKLSLGGYMDNFIGMSTNKSSYLNTISGQPNIGGFDVQQDSEVHVIGSTKLDNGLTVGVKWEMETNAGAQSANTDSASVYISSATLGTIDLGSDDNAADKMHNAPSTASSFNLEIGDNAQWIQAPSKVTYERWTRSTGAKDYYGISYRSPSFGGFQVGGSYTAGTDENPQTSNGAISDKDMWTAAVAYSGKFSDVSVKADLFYAAQGSGETHGSLNPAGMDQVGGGLKIGFGAFEVAGAYRSIDQGKATGGSSMDGKVFSVGAGYTSGPMQVTISWLRSKMEGSVAVAADDQVDLYTLQGGYDLGGGVKLSAVLEKAKYDDETTAAANNNEGWAAVAGVQVSF